MQQQDPRTTIGRLEFPKSTREALSHLEQLCIPLAQVRPPTAKQLDYISEVIDDLIFMEPIGKKGLRRKKMSAVQELQVLLVLCDYFASPASPDGVRNTVFMMIFSPGSKLDSISDERMQLLGKLISLALSLKNSAVLNCAGVWMQQRGCSKEHLLGLTKTIADDHIVLSSNKSELIRWVELSPHFTSSFLSAIAEVYSGAGTGNLRKQPPPRLLFEVATEWIVSTPNLALTPLLINLQPLLPKGSIVMTPTTPFVGLIRWCVEMPLLRLLSKIEATQDDLHSTADLEAKLLLGLLESMNEKPNLENVLQQPEVISPRHMCSLVKGILERFKEIPDDLQRDPLAQLSLDRLGQAVQISLASGCLYGNTHELFQALRQLPANRLLQIIIYRHT